MDAILSASACEEVSATNGGAFFRCSPSILASDVVTSLQLALNLLADNVVSLEALHQAADLQSRLRPQIGQVAMERRWLSMKQVFEVLKRQCDEQEPFGKIACELGYLNTEQVDLLLGAQLQRTPSIGTALLQLGCIEETTLRTYEQQVRDQMTLMLNTL